MQVPNPRKLVYSPHVYGPDVFMQSYFAVPDFPANMPRIWTEQWGHIGWGHKLGPAVILGRFLDCVQHFLPITLEVGV